jgi:D-alanyl-D-alanine carboxypeptidase (penicillin-binding protein 5/6)
VCSSDLFNTNFENTNGLDSENLRHKTTAKDLIKIAKYCMANTRFRELVSLKEADIFINGKKIPLKNTNTLLNNDYIKGIKTGYTNNAGFCLLTYSEKDDIKLISVVLNSSPCGKNFDTLRLLGWVYDNYEYKEIISSENAAVAATAENSSSSVNFDLYPEKDMSVLFNKNEDRAAFNFKIDKYIGFPVIKNKSYGSMVVELNDTNIRELKLYSKQDIASPEIKTDYLNFSSLILIRWLLIFILSFYFLTFTFIIIKNLTRLKT